MESLIISGTHITSPYVENDTQLNLFITQVQRLLCHNLADLAKQN